MEEGKLTMGKKVRSEKEGICGGLQHEVQRVSTRNVAVRREKGGQIPWSWERGELHFELNVTS